MATLTEFEFIECYITNIANQRSDVVVSVGDDAAIVDVPSDKSLVITVDSLIAGRHFLPDTPTHALGFRILAVNLSDLAAMGAQPTWATLALTIPSLDTAWLDDFFQGYTELAQRYDIELIGGNTAQGPLNLTLQMHGLVPKNKGLRRSGAKVGDQIIVTGTLGDAALALRFLQGEALPVTDEQKDFLLQKLYYPTPRIALGMALIDVAHAAIDISDGLVADLNHILQASNVGARLYLDKLPVSTAMKHLCDAQRYLQYALYSGDAYELCFTMPSDKLIWLEKTAKQCDVTYTVIGEIVEKKYGVIGVDSNHNSRAIPIAGWEHFK